jgi:hypothetical protein
VRFDGAAADGCRPNVDGVVWIVIAEVGRRCELAASFVGVNRVVTLCQPHPPIEDVSRNDLSHDCGGLDGVVVEGGVQSYRRTFDPGEKLE